MREGWPRRCTYKTVAVEDFCVWRRPCSRGVASWGGGGQQNRHSEADRPVRVHTHSPLSTAAVSPPAGPTVDRRALTPALPNLPRRPECPVRTIPPCPQTTSFPRTARPVPRVNLFFLPPSFE